MHSDSAVIGSGKDSCKVRHIRLAGQLDDWSETYDLYHTKAYLQQFKELPVHLFVAEAPGASAYVAFQVQGRYAYALRKAPWGGPQGDEHLFTPLMAAADAWLVASGLGAEMMCRQPISLPAPWRLAAEPLAHRLDLQHPGPVHAMQRRRLSKAQRQGLTCGPWSGTVAGFYDLVAAFRAASGIPLTIDCPAFEHQVQLLPDHYHLLAARKGREVLAVLAVVRVSAQEWYYFLPASDPTTSHLSPMVPLLLHAADLAKQHGASYLELGRSWADGHDQQSLATFKERMGATPRRWQLWTRPVAAR